VISIDTNMLTSYRISSGIVTFNPDIKKLSINLSKLLEQVPFVIIVDNFSKNFNEIFNLVNSNKKVLLVSQNHNSGVAAALNIIMEKSKLLGFNWVLTLDQDSSIDHNTIRTFTTFLDIEKIAIVCPLVVDLNIGIFDNISNSEFQFVTQCITSSSLTSIDAWEKIGYFDEDLFIDEVDFDFCKRLIDNGYKILRTNKVKLSHEIGQAKKVKFFCLFKNVLNHGPTRKYYMARNIVYLSYKHRTGLISSHFRVFKLFASVFLYENKKVDKLFNILKGILDGHKLAKKNHYKRRVL